MIDELFPYNPGLPLYTSTSGLCVDPRFFFFFFLAWQT
jgi:hypothetical protein